MSKVFRLHGLPKEIVPNKDAKSTSNLWKGFY